MSSKKLTLVPFGSTKRNSGAINVLNAETLLGIIEVYSRATRTENPCTSKLKKGQRRILSPKRDISGIRKELKDGHTWPHYRFPFCSKNNTAVLTLEKVVSGGGDLYVGIGLTPDERIKGNQHADIIIAKFHRELQKYVDGVVKSRIAKKQK